jgi:hypothetical protein
MLRWAFATYVVLVMAAGPGLCCCSLTHLFAGHADRQPAPADLPPCCQHASDSEGQQGQGDCPGEKEKDDSHKPGCPCRQVEAKPAALPERAVEVPDEFQAGSFLLGSPLAAAFDGPMPLIGGPALPGGGPPFLTAWDLLHVHHQLRC